MGPTGMQNTSLWNSPRTSPPTRSRMLLRPTSHPHLVYPIATNAFIRDLGPLRARLIADRVHPAARTSAAPPTIMNVPLDRTSPRGPLRGIVFRCAWQHVLHRTRTARRRQQTSDAWGCATALDAALLDSKSKI